MSDDAAARCASPLANAPAFLLFVAYCAFLFLRGDFGCSFLVAATAAILVPAGWTLLGMSRFERGALPVIWILLLFALAGTLSFAARLRPEPALPVMIAAQGVVQAERSWGQGRIALVATRSGKFVLRLTGEENVSPGMRLSFSGRLVAFRGARHPGAFDEFRYWKARGALAAVADPEIIVRGVAVGPARWRHILGERIRSTLPQRTAGYISAAWIGTRDPLLEHLHRQAGTSHLLAVSGFHVGIVFALCWFLLRGFRHRLVWIGVAVWSYAVLTGAAPSALRAAFMAQVVILGRMAGRAGNGFNSTAVAGTVLLLWNPWLFWDVGWRLSMLAVLALTAVSFLRIAGGLKTMLAGALVWLATSVQATRTFGETPLAGLFLNFFALPVFGVLFPLASLVSLPALLGLPGGYRLASAVEFLFGRWERVSYNVLALCPWRVPYSTTLAACGVVALSYCFGRACGFSAGRAWIAVGINLSALFFAAVLV